MEDLICGVDVATNEYADADYIGLVNRLRTDLADIHKHVLTAVNSNSELPASAVFPFLSRKFLELSLTAILARIDPIRVTAARKGVSEFLCVRRGYSPTVMGKRVSS